MIVFYDAVPLSSQCLEEEVLVPLTRPRDLSADIEPRAAGLIRHIWNNLEGEVRSKLGVRHD